MDSTGHFRETVSQQDGIPHGMSWYIISLQFPMVCPDTYFFAGLTPTLYFIIGL